MEYSCCHSRHPQRRGPCTLSAAQPAAATLEVQLRANVLATAGVGMHKSQKEDVPTIQATIGRGAGPRAAQAAVWPHHQTAIPARLGNDAVHRHHANAHQTAEVGPLQ